MWTSGKYGQDPPTQIKTQNIEKQEALNWIETQYTKNWNITDPSTTNQRLTQDKINAESIKKIMTENKSTLPFCRNLDLKKVKVETKKGKQINTKYPKEQNQWTKQTNLCRGENQYSLKESKQKYKTWIEKQVKKLGQQLKVLRKEKHTGICWDEKPKNSQQVW